MNDRTSVGRAVAQFALSGFAAVLLLGLAGAFALRHVARDEAVRDAGELTSLAGRGIVAPLVGRGVVAGNRAALRRLDDAVRRRVLGRDVVRVKLWRPDGTIVYSDDRRLIGARYALGPDERRVLTRGGVEAEVSDLTRPENRFEPRGRKLLEVYFPIDTDAGPLLYEEYLRSSSVAATSRRLWLSFLPALAAGLLLLELVQLPLALGLARRVRAAQREREALLTKALDASNVERRRIARDLHDGAVQDLAGTAFSLSATASRLRGRGDDEAATAVAGGAVALRSAVRRLRSMLVTIYPPHLERAGLEAALADVVAPAVDQGLDVHVAVPDDLDISADVETLLFRTAQEAVRNTLAHADASRLAVEVGRTDGRATLLVADDGRGFSAADQERARDGGHLGLSLLTDLARDAGGSLEVASEAGGGTRVRLEVPL